jgi:hypothetical protein
MLKFKVLLTYFIDEVYFNIDELHLQIFFLQIFYNTLSTLIVIKIYFLTFHEAHNLFNPVNNFL